MEQATDAYDVDHGRREEPYLGVLITYPAESEFESRAAADFSEVIQVAKKAPSRNLAGEDKVGVGLLGAGSFAAEHADSGDESDRRGFD